MVYYQVSVERLTRFQAVELLRQCVSSGKIIPGKHFRDELANEKLDIQDALRVLKTGQIYNEPEQDIKCGDWKYHCEGRELEGKSLAIVFCFQAVDTAFLITVFSISSKGKR